MTAMFWLGKSGALFTERERSALEVWVGTGRRSWRHGGGGVLAALVVRRVGWAGGLVWPVVRAACAEDGGGSQPPRAGH